MPKDRENSKPEKKFRIEDIPEDQRRKIFKITVAAIMTIIFSLWLIFLVYSFSLENSKAGRGDWNIIKNDISDFINSSKNVINIETKKIEGQIDYLTPTTTNDANNDANLGDSNIIKEDKPTLTTEETGLIKEKILEIQNQIK